MVNYRKYQKRREYTCVTGPRHNIDVGAQMKQCGEQEGRKKEKKKKVRCISNLTV
jgi:hypothetical protein